jgi:AcrR family transcriptional regulator
MLLHYFGSRDELLLAVVQEVERRQAARLPDLPADPVQAALALWADLRAIELRPFERLFFECYARAAQGEAPFTRLLPGAVHAWVDAVAARAPGTVDRTLIGGGWRLPEGCC